MKSPNDILAEFDNKFGLSGLQSRPLEYASLSEDKYDEVRAFLRTSLAEVVRWSAQKTAQPFGTTHFSEDYSAETAFDKGTIMICDRLLALANEIEAK